MDSKRTRQQKREMGAGQGRFLWRLFLLGMAIACAFTPGRRLAAQTPAPPDAAVTSAPPADPNASAATRITPGCLLGVTVTDEPKLTGAFLVEASGNIHFSLTDSDGGNRQAWTVGVSGKTTDEAQIAIAAALKTILLAPEVRVVIAKLPRLKIEVYGPARKTGVLELPLQSRLSDALAACRYQSEADLEKILVRRIIKGDDKNLDKARTMIVDFAAFQRGESEDDLKLEAGDRITLTRLPETPVATQLKMVRVVGEVAHEANLPYSAGMTVNDALDRVGGLKETADREKVRLIRASDGKDFVLDANRVGMNDPVHNLPLTPGDLLIVGVRDQSLRYAVLGEVLDPRTFIWNPKEKVSLLQALEQVGGVTKRGDKRKGVLRKGYLLNPTASRDVVFDLDAIVKGKQQNWDIDAGDAVFILPKQHRPSLLQQIAPLMLRFLPFGL